MLRSTDLVGQVVEALAPLVASGEPAPLHEPWLDSDDIDAVAGSVKGGWVSTAGPSVPAFEKALADYTGASHVTCVNNGTAALHAALLVAGVAPGDEVLVPAISFVATANAVSYCGAHPHFVDVDRDTIAIDANRLRSHLEAVARVERGRATNRTTGRRIAAVLPVHTLGHIVDMAPILGLADEFGLAVVEDAAQSVGSFRSGRHAGRWGSVGALSFNGNKIVTTGGGGAVLTENPDTAARVRHLTTTAKRPHPWLFEHDAIGFNYRMPNLNAALGISQLSRVETFVESKRALADWYRTRLANVGGLRLVQEPEAARSNYWLSAFTLPADGPELRDSMLQALHGRGIQARPLWTPLHLLPMYAACERADVRVAEAAASGTICLPSGAKLAARVPAVRS